jgi:putative transposase
MDEVFPGTCHQRCWFHKVANVLNNFPKSMQPAVTADLREISHAETRAAALAAIETFKEKYAAKYERAVVCLTKDTETLLAFYGLRPFPPQTIPRMVCRFADRHSLPAEHWDHLRISNPIESVFATVRHRTVRTKGALSQKMARLMVFPLVRVASKKWRRLNGTNQLRRVIEGIKFTDGVAQGNTTQSRAA